MNNLVAVAHPDDETIFMGGTILTYPKENWDIVCMTYSLNDVRGIQFKEAMGYYERMGVNLTFRCLGLEDSLLDMTVEEGDQWKQELNKLNLHPDRVYTHNSVGEYKHQHHIAINKIVNELYDNVWEFICPAMWRKQVVHQPFKSEHKIIPLKPEILKNKNDIYNYCYPGEIENWRTIPDVMRFEFCSGFEVFTK